jgi:hypothetical protein
MEKLVLNGTSSAIGPIHRSALAADKLADYDDDVSARAFVLIYAMCEERVCMDMRELRHATDRARLAMANLASICNSPESSSMPVLTMCSRVRTAEILNDYMCWSEVTLRSSQRRQ